MKVSFTQDVHTQMPIKSDSRVVTVDVQFHSGRKLRRQRTNNCDSSPEQDFPQPFPLF